MRVAELIFIVALAAPAAAAELSDESTVADYLAANDDEQFEWWYAAAAKVTAGIYQDKVGHSIKGCLQQRSTKVQGDTSLADVTAKCGLDAREYLQMQERLDKERK